LAAAPFATGVTSLVWAANPTLTASQVEEMSTAHPGVKLAFRTVDALAAVSPALGPDLPPDITITSTTADTLNEWENRVWVKVHPLRDGGWASDCVTLCVGEQPVSDAAPLMAGRDEQLLDQDRPAFGAVQGDVAGGLALIAGDEGEAPRAPDRRSSQADRQTRPFASPNSSGRSASVRGAISTVEVSGHLLWLQLVRIGSRLI
jgi:hypothetical protein